MRGIKHFNFPRFKHVAKDLRKRGYLVIDPSDNPPGLTWEAYMALDLGLVCQSDAVVVFSNKPEQVDYWRKSEGATWEVETALRLKKPVLVWPDMEPLQEEAPDAEANRLIYGARQGSYGPPTKDFARTAKMWSGLWRDKLKAEIEPHEVGYAMNCLKLSRLMEHPKKDSFTDSIGYLLCSYRIVNNLP